MDDQIVQGRVMHARLSPVSNFFVYPVFFLRMRLDGNHSQPSLLFGRNRWRPVALWDKDYGPRDGTDLYSWAVAQFAQAGIGIDGKIVLQAFPRVWGYLFHPVSFFMAYDAKDRLQAVLADVNNTFGEHTHYLLDVQQHPEQLVCEKTMHVSPFNCLEGRYVFRFRERNGRRSIWIDYWTGDQLVLRTSMAGRDQPLKVRNLAAALLRQPLLTFGIMLRILVQALRLWRKGLTFQSLATIQKNRQKGAVS